MNKKGRINNTYSSISSKKSVGQWNTQIKTNRFEHIHLHANKFNLKVSAVTYVQKIINLWGCSFLQQNYYQLFKNCVRMTKFPSFFQLTHQLFILTSYLQAINNAAAPNNCSFSFCTVTLLR